MTNSITIDCELIQTQEAPKTTEEFKQLRDRARIFCNGITNKYAKLLNFNSIKSLISDQEIELNPSLENEDLIIETTLHKYIDYCLEKTSLEANYYYDSTGVAGVKTYTDEPIYMISKNVCHDESLRKFVACPEYLGDWFDKYFPYYRDLAVYGKRHTWFFIGPKNTKSEMHTDHDNIHTTIQQLDGVKRFFLLSPEDISFINKELPPNFFASIEFKILDNGSCEVLDLSGERDLSIMHEVNLLYGDLHPGDLVYLPANWGHYANSLKPSISVSRDFIDERNADLYFTSIVLNGDVERLYMTITDKEMKRIERKVLET